MPRTRGTAPPLPEEQHMCIMRRHRHVDLQHRPAGEREPSGKVGLLARNRLLVEAARRAKCCKADGHDATKAAAAGNEARGRSPLDRAKAVVKRCLGVSLIQMASHDAAIPILSKG